MPSSTHVAAGYHSVMRPAGNETATDTLRSTGVWKGEATQDLVREVTGLLTRELTPQERSIYHLD